MSEKEIEDLKEEIKRLKEKPPEIFDKKGELKKNKEEINDLKEKVKSVSTELARVAKEKDELASQIDKAVNTAAYHSNLSKRYQQDYEVLKKYRSQDLIENLIPVLDAFNFAFKNEAPPEAKNYLIGFNYVYSQLLKILEDEGVKIIEPKKGDKFDASIHNAIESIPTVDNTLVHTIEKFLTNGYQLKERLIKPANVIVYVEGQEEEQENAQVHKED
ncbi:MAG: nucleotide exchange factor GrpE [Bacillales bacterium]|jgi:molecular chaperone GrpE|nr:nucleotide exchange factor GrpE [Bacillales bacterium]